MSDRRVRYILDVDYEGGTVALQAADDLRDVESAARGAGEGIERNESAWTKAQAAWVTAGSVLSTVKMGFDEVQQAAQKAYDLLAGGADLAMQENQFAALAASIGSTASVLENDLATATGGLQSNAEMMAGASQLMSLGLAKNHDEVVALSSVAGQLNWDIQILGLTIANQSTARLDSLGLSIESVKTKMAQFQALGMESDEAFKWAIIESGREKIEVLGNAAETSAGKLQIMENVVKNIQDEFAKNLAVGFADGLAEIAGNAQAAGSALEFAAAGGGAKLGQVLGQLAELLLAVTPGLQFLILQGAELEMVAAKEAAAREEQVRSYQWLIDQHERYYTTAAYTATSTAALTMATEDWGYVAQDVAERQSWLARATEMVAEAQERAASADRERAASLAEMNAQSELAALAQQLWTEYTSEATSRGGDYFTQITEGGRATFDLGQAIYDMADAGGAGISILGDIGVEYGLMSEKVREAGENLAGQQAIVNFLGQAAAEGRIPWDEYVIAVEKALSIFEGGAPELPAPTSVRAPIQIDMTETGDYYHMTEDMFPKVEISPTANMTEVEAAVAEAQGMLEGFAATPWEAQATLDTKDVEEGVSRISAALAEIPEYRQIRLDFTATGLEFLDDLRAAGVIQ